jgi:pilus assembly protein CpaF
MTQPRPLLERVRHRMAGPDSTALIDAARRESMLLVDQVALTELAEELNRELIGTGALEPLLDTPGVTDVLVNGADEVWIDRGAGLELTLVRFDSDEAVRRLAARLAAQAGRRLDDASPHVDASLPDGTRLHAILPPLVRRPAVSLRVLQRRRLSLADLIDREMLGPELASVLTDCVRARQTLLISGGAGSGKTTLLSALLAAVDPGERILTIEDAAELTIQHPHVVGLFARTENGEHAGAVEAAELVRQALRMRADRLVVGEFRGREMVEVLAALNTGHSGGAATVHANSVRDVGTRLVALAALAGVPSEVAQAQAASAIDILIHVRRDRHGHRRVDEVALWPAAAERAPVTVWSRRNGFHQGVEILARRCADADEPVGLPAIRLPE